MTRIFRLGLIGAVVSAVVATVMWQAVNRSISRALGTAWTETPAPSTLKRN